MKIRYTLFEMLMTADPSDVALPPVSAVFDTPGEGWAEQVWTKAKASGATALCVLWACPEDWEGWQARLEEWEPGDAIPDPDVRYVPVQDGMSITVSGAETVFSDV